jgi:CRP/FNR family transcriptional regulator, anaerobic regulatory protein
MSRHEIGSHLGLTLETVSRTFSAFAEGGLLEVERRAITLRDPPALRGLAHAADQFNLGRCLPARLPSPARLPTGTPTRG